MKLLTFPQTGTNDIPAGLRKLADQIEADVYDDAHNLAWIIDCGDSRIEFGLLGKAISAGAEFNMLLDFAKYKIVSKI